MQPSGLFHYLMTQGEKYLPPLVYSEVIPHKLQYLLINRVFKEQCVSFYNDTYKHIESAEFLW